MLEFDNEQLTVSDRVVLDQCDWRCDGGISQQENPFLRQKDPIRGVVSLKCIYTDVHSETHWSSSQKRDFITIIITFVKKFK